MAATKIAFPLSALDREIQNLERLVSEVIEANLRFLRVRKDRDGYAPERRTRLLLEVLSRG